MKEEVKQDKEEVDKFILDSLDPKRERKLGWWSRGGAVDAKLRLLFKFEKHAEFYDGSVGIMEEWRPNELADYAVAHAVTFHMFYFRVPESAELSLPRKGETPDYLVVPWNHTSENTCKPCTKGGRATVTIAWDDGTSTQGLSICSVIDTWSYSEARKHAVHDAIRQRVNSVRSKERAEAAAARELKKSGTIVLDDAQKATISK